MTVEDAACGTLALPYNPGGERSSSGGLVLGAHVFVRSFYRALLQHGTLPRYRFFTMAPLVASAREQIDAFAAARRSPLQSVDVRAQLGLARMLEKETLLAYHEPNLGGDEMFALRRALARQPFPITLLNHSFSYRAMLHSTFLRLLLADMRPYDSVICSSQAARQAIRVLLDHVAARFADDYGTRLSMKARMDVIPLGIDTELWRPRDRTDLRVQLDLPLDATILLYLGRLSTVDKADLRPLVDVFARLQHRLRGSKLLFVIAGTERDGDAAVLRAHIAAAGLSRSVRLLMEPKAPHLLLGAADIFVSPADSVQEAFGLTPLEAMASGVPQVVADWDGYRETVVDGQTGFLVPTLWAEASADLQSLSPLLSREWLDHLLLGQSVVIDTEVLYQRLHLLVTQPALRQQLGEASRRRAVEQYAWPVVIAQYERLWCELAAMARQDHQPPRPQATYNDPPFWSAFAHYATRVLAEEEGLCVTPLGCDVLAGDRVLPVSHNAELLDPQIAADLLRHCADSARVASFGQLAGWVSTQRRRPIAVGRRHVLWLLKHGLLAVQTSSP